MKIFAHRGWRAGQDENTLAAFKKSIENKVDGVEFDIRYGADRRSVVVSHDEVKGDSVLTIGEALQVLQETELELLIEFKEYCDELYASVVEHLEKHGLVGRTTIFAFPDIAKKFPWGKKRIIKLGIIAPYPHHIKKYVKMHEPDMVLFGWGNEKERLLFRILWKFFSLKNTFSKYPAIKFIIGVAYREEDRLWLSKHEGIYGATADLPLS